MAPTGPALFISDLHLHPDRPAATACFRQFLAGPARQARSLYILGDLFEAWVGDDAASAHDEAVLSDLAALTGHGVRVAFLAGNRDFLAGAGFSRRTGCRLLGDFERVDLFGRPVLLAHGDLLCTDDVRYLELRRQLRDPAWQSDFLAKSLDERRRLAAELRRLSQAEMAAKSEAIMDVNENAVRETMRRFDVRVLLHGHTHRPAIHSLTVNGRPATRVVLGDWYEQGSVLRLSGDGLALSAL